MRAIICDRYGPPDILRIEEVERPVPADDEVLVGDRVFGVYPFWGVRAGAHAEFMCIPEQKTGNVVLTVS
jgi:NADPH:quinone reductase-like Zn-dependent oxidoreductase